MKKENKQVALDAIMEYYLQVQTLNLKTGEIRTIKEAEEEHKDICARRDSIYEYLADQSMSIGKKQRTKEEAMKEGDSVLLHLREMQKEGNRTSSTRIRVTKNGKYEWLNHHLYIPKHYSEDDPWVLLFWSLAEKSASDYEDAMGMLERSYCHVIRINLTEDTYENILSDDDDVWFMGSCFSESIRIFAEYGGVHTEDREDFLQKMQMDVLRNKTTEGVESVYHTYRRRIKGEYRWCSLEMFRSSDYMEDHQVVVMFVRDIHERHKEELSHQKQLEFYAYTDALTGLQNRAGYNRICNEFQQEMNKHCVGMIFADINGLKYVNDNYGHEKGDQYLRIFADKIIELYGRECCFRFSGDEFMVVLQHLNEAHFKEQYARLDQFLMEQPSPMAAVGCYWMRAPKSIEVVEREAEKEMYAAKRAYYQKYHGVMSEERMEKRQNGFDVERILGAQTKTTDDGETKLDRAGLSNRVFDVFATTSKRGYLFLCNRQTNVSRWSKRAVEDFDLPGEYMYDAGAIWEAYIHPEDRQEYHDSMEKLYAGEIDRQHLTYRAKDRNGEYVICSCESAIIKGEGDEPDYFAGTITNYGIADCVDSVTHLPSKTAFLSNLEDILQKREDGVVMMIVLDHMSDITTLYGYRLSDDVLRQFGARLHSLVGDRGQVYHVDYSMFGICLQPMDRHQIESLYAAIQRMGFVGLEVQGNRITLKTLGSAAVLRETNGAADAITAHLGFSVGQSKAAYHGELVFCRPQMRKKEVGDRLMLGAVYQDIMAGCNGFHLLYQPIVDAEAGKIVGAEALVRWHHEEYGEVPPNRFIPFIEQSTSIFELGNWVIWQALQDAAEMRRYIPDFIINVNVASPQLERKEFRAEVMHALYDTGYPPQNLCLELTERCRDLDLEFLRQEVEYFREQGVRVAMDDFGTGSASLQLVLKLPLDEIKIDRTFVKDIQNQDINQVLVSAMSQGAKTIDADLCIEGIEDQELEEYLRRYQPTYYQGYYYSRPVDRETFLSLISS